MKTTLKAVTLFWILFIVVAFGFQFVPDSAVFGESDDPAKRSVLYPELSYIAGVFDDFHQMVNDYPQDSITLPVYKLKLTKGSVSLLEPDNKPEKWEDAVFSGNKFQDTISVRATRRIENGIRLRFPKNHFFDRKRNLIVRPANAQSVAFKYQELVANELNLITPGVEFIKLTVDNSQAGTWMAEERADKYFLEKTRVSSGAAFEHCFSSTDAACLQVASEDTITGEIVNEQLTAYYLACEAGDFGIAEDIFDLDYIAGFVLANAIADNPEFLFEQTEYFYTWTNGKITPVFRPAKGDAMRTYQGRSVSRNIYTPLLKYDGFLQRLRDRSVALALKHDKLAEKFAASDRQYAAALSYSNANTETSDRESLYRLGQQKQKLLSRIKDTETIMGWLGQFEERFDAIQHTPASQIVYHPGQQPKNAAALFAAAHNLTLKGDTLYFSGSVKVNETWFVPAGLTLVFEGGTQLSIAADQSVISYSPIVVRGTEQQPVSITAADPNQPYGTFLVVGNNAVTCTATYLNVSRGNEARINGLYCSGQFGLHHSNAQLSHCNFFGGVADDGLNVKYGEIHIDHCRFYQNYADQVDLDFCTGIVENCRFDNNSGDSNGDGLDFSGSRVVVRHCTFDHFMDKGISIGENSDIYIANNLLTNNTLGMAVKDLSKAYVVDNKFEGNGTCFALYQKKQLFGGSTLYSYTNEYVNNHWKIDSDSLSSVKERILMEDKVLKEFGISGDD